MFVLPIVLGSLVVAAQPPAPRPVSPDELAARGAWVKANAHPLNDVPVDGPSDDLAPVMDLIGDARIVGIGSGIVGARQDPTLHHRIIRRLIAEKGFSVLVTSGMVAEMGRVDEYIRTGNGDPAQLLAKTYSPSDNTSDMLGTVNLLREHASAGRPARIFGIGTHTLDAGPFVVLDLLKDVDPEMHETAADWYARADKAGGGFGPELEMPMKAPNLWARLRHTPIPIEAGGKKLRVSAWVKTGPMHGGSAGLTAAAGIGAPDPYVLEPSVAVNSGPAAIATESDWTRLTIELEVPGDATWISFGTMFDGQGTAWFDDMRVELDGQPLPNGLAPDLDFESPETKHWSMSVNSNAFDLTMDDKVAHGGSRSMRLRTTLDPAKPPLTFAGAADVCRRVHDHVVAHKDEYLKKTDADRVEWAIHNAEVCAEFFKNIQGARSLEGQMLTWILERTPPDAKIIILTRNDSAGVTKGAGRWDQGSLGYSIWSAKPEDYIAISTLVCAGEIGTDVRRDRKIIPLDAPVPESAEGALAASDISIGFLNLKAASPAHPDSAWLFDNLGVRSSVRWDGTGAENYRPVNLGNTFHGLLWIGDAEPASKLSPSSKP